LHAYKGVETSVSKYIAQVQRVLDKTGLTFEMHSYGTTVQGPWSQVCQAIQSSHKAVHAMGCNRVATDVRIGTRIDKAASMEEKVKSVRDLLD